MEHNGIQIQFLAQNEADDLMKSLEGQYLANFKEAFHEEKDKPRDQPWALPAEKRQYYRVESYLFGVNCENLYAVCLSSFARIDATSPKGNCAMCLKYLIEAELFPLCRSQNKRKIVAKLAPPGAKVFEVLRSMMPGVSLRRGYYADGLIEVPFVSNAL